MDFLYDYIKKFDLSTAVTATVSFIVLAFIIMYPSFIIRINNDTSLEVEANTKPEEVRSEIRDPFEGISLSAQSAYVWDVAEQKSLYELNANQKLPLASVTKVMTALTAVDLVPKYTVITVEKEFLEMEGDSGLFGGERWKLKDLLDFSLMVSSNDGTRAIASVVGAINKGTDDYSLGLDDFIEHMNEKSKTIGLENTSFTNETGLDNTEIMGGAYGTAQDMAKLFEHAILYYPETIEATKFASMPFESLHNISHNATNTNQVTGSIPGLIASKTGFTDLAGGNLIIAFDPGIGRPIIISVLGSTLNGRFEDILKLVNASIESIQMNETLYENI